MYLETFRNRILYDIVDDKIAAISSVISSVKCTAAQAN